jgi:hypothetical protein
LECRLSHLAKNRRRSLQLFERWLGSVTAVSSCEHESLAARRSVFCAAIPLFVIAFPPASLASDALSTLTPFSKSAVGASIPGWAFQPLRGVKTNTRYALVQDESTNTTVVEATANASAGALGVRMDADAKATPNLRFKWRVGGLIESSDPTTKAGDDYSARIYVTFAYDPERATFKEKTENAFARTLYGETPPHAALAYVFTHRAKQNQIITSPFTGRVKKIVVDADPASVNQWRSFERNVYDDYKRAFNEEPTRISGIAIMVDTDNTGESAKSRFGDITLSAQ